MHSPKRESYELHKGDISDKHNLSSLSVSTEPSDSNGKVKENIWGKYFHLKINLNPGITMGNYFASLIHVIIVQFNHTVTSALQPMILLDPDSYNADKSEVGRLVAKLVFLQTLTKICLTPFYGYLMDHIGRKPMIILGACVACTGYLLVPYQTSIFPGYAISKILVANGGNMMTLAPLNADYIHDSTKGKATAISMAWGSVGQFLGSLFITMMIGMNVSLSHTHMYAGLTVISVVLAYSTKIKSGKYFLHKHENHSEEDQQKDEKRSSTKFSHKVKQAFSTLNQNSWLMISVALSILARADYYLVTMVFGLFVKSFDTTPEQTTESNKLVNSYQNLFFGLEVVGNLVYGFILDRVNTLHIIFPTLIAAMAGYTMGAFADSKDSSLLLILIFFAGTAMPGLLNSASYLAIKNYPNELRGILSSLISVMGVAGYLFLSTVGGYSFDHFGRSSPFVLFVFMLIVSMLSIIYIYRRGNLRKKIRLNYVENETGEENQRLDTI